MAWSVRSAASLPRRTHRWGSSPVVAATISPASSASPPIPPEPWRPWPTAMSGRSTSELPTGAASSASPPAASTPTPTGSPTSRACGGGMFVAPHAELDDGELDVITVSDVSKLRYIRGLPKAFKGTHLANEEVDERRAATVEIRADRDFAVYADGEHLTDLPATLSVLPRALRVIAPPGPLVGPPS